MLKKNNYFMEEIKRLELAQKALQNAKQSLYVEMVSTVRTLFMKYNVDHLCFENFHNSAVFYDDDHEDVKCIFSVRTPPDGDDTLEITNFVKEEWEKAEKEYGYIWIDYWDTNVDHWGLADAILTWADLKEQNLI